MKIELTIAISFFSSKDTDEEHVMHSKIDNIEIMIYNKSDEVIKELFESLLNRYQTGLDTSMKGSDFIFDWVNLFHYKCHKINLKCAGSYIDSPDWIKKATIHPIDDDTCFQYAPTVALNHADIGQHLQRISTIKPFTNKYDWKGINYPSRKDDLKMFEKNNPTSALTNVLHI